MKMYWIVIYYVKFLRRFLRSKLPTLSFYLEILHNEMFSMWSITTKRTKLYTFTGYPFRSLQSNVRNIAINYKQLEVIYKPHCIQVNRKDLCIQFLHAMQGIHNSFSWKIYCKMNKLMFVIKFIRFTTEKFVTVH